MIFSIFFVVADFDVFGPILFLFAPSRPPPPPAPQKKQFSPPFSFYIRNRVKIGFPTPVSESRFLILNLHPKKLKKKLF